MKSTRPTSRRALVLLSVLVVVTISALVGASVVYRSDAEQAAAGLTLRKTRTRALAWSGVQGAMAEFLAQREDLLTGARPTLTSEWTLWEDGNTRGVIRLLPIGIDEEAAVSESAKLDINNATAEMLEAIPGISSSIAERIVAQRSGRPYQSVEELLLRVEGVTSELLYGHQSSESASGTLAASAAPSSESDIAPGAELVEGPTDPLLNSLTVFSFDPNVQAGLGDNGSAHVGRRRINLNMEWSDELGRAVEQRFDDQAAQTLERLMNDESAKFTRDADIIAVLRRFGIEDPAVWSEMLDAFTTTDDEYRLGRVDLLNAPTQVLAAIPGIDAFAAEEIVQSREGLSQNQRLTTVWPFELGILSPDAFAEAVDYLQSRSLQWRVRVEGAIVRGGSSESGDGLLEENPFEGMASIDMDALGERSTPEADSREVLDRVVLDVVIDVSSSRPRVAYLRDISLMPVARILASHSKEIVESLSADSGLQAGVVFEDEAALAGTAFDDPFGEFPPADPFAFPDDPFLDDDPFASDPNGFFPPFDDSADFLQDEPNPDMLAEPSIDDRPLAASAAEDDVAPEGASGDVEQGRDRRIGRWTAGGGR